MQIARSDERRSVAPWRLGIGSVGFLALVLCLAAATPARAQFYSLEGRYQCLNDPSALCYDATPGTAPLKAKAAATPAAEAPPQSEAKASPTGAAAPSAIPADPLAAVATRLQSGAASPRDIALLRDRAAAGDERATELLAWCHLKGVGMPKDPVPAYLLYGVAAKLGVPNARRNQAIVYETDMTPEQRQIALTIEDRVILGAAHD